MIFSCRTVLLLLAYWNCNGAPSPIPLLKLHHRIIYGKYVADEDLHASLTSTSNPAESHVTTLVSSNSTRAFSLPIPEESAELSFLVMTIAGMGDPRMVVYEATLTIDQDCVLFNMGTIIVGWRLARLTPSDDDIEVSGKSLVPGSIISSFKPSQTAYESILNRYDALFNHLEVAAKRRWVEFQEMVYKIRSSITVTLVDIHAHAEAVAVKGVISSVEDAKTVLISFAVTLLGSATVSVTLMLLRWTCGACWACWTGDALVGEEVSVPADTTDSEEESYWTPQGPPQRILCESAAAATGSIRVYSQSSSSSCAPIGSQSQFQSQSDVSMHGLELKTPVTGARGAEDKDKDNPDDFFNLLLKIDSFSSVRLKEYQLAHQRQIERIFDEETE